MPVRYATPASRDLAEDLCRTPGISRLVWHAWAVRASLWQTSLCLRLSETAHFALFREVNEWLRAQRWERAR